MKNELNYIKRKPVAFVSLVVLCVFYVAMIFAEYLFANSFALSTFMCGP